MKLFFITVGIVVLMSACQSQDTKSTRVNQSNLHKVEVEEVLQTSNYTYLRVKENDAERWLAVPKMQAEKGGTYYYQGGMEMNKFESKELSRTFETVVFLERLSAEPATENKSASRVSTHTKSPITPHTSKVKGEKENIKIDPAKGGITIAELFSGKESYKGKIVKIRGKVMKFSAAIMGKNWIHLQDGTDHSGNYDLTVTANTELKVGDTVTVEGKISLDLDLGFGYFYEVIMEDAVIK